MQTFVAALALLASTATAYNNHPRHFALFRRDNVTISDSGALTTLTVLTTEIQTVTSCAPTITDCPANPQAQQTVLVTNTVVLTSTVCPVTEAAQISSSVLAEAATGGITGSTISGTITAPPAGPTGDAEDDDAEESACPPDEVITTTEVKEVTTEKVLTMTVGRGDLASVVTTTIQSTIRSTIFVTITMTDDDEDDIEEATVPPFAGGRNNAEIITDLPAPAPAPAPTPAAEEDAETTTDATTTTTATTTGTKTVTVKKGGQTFVETIIETGAAKPVASPKPEVKAEPAPAPAPAPVFDDDSAAECNCPAAVTVTLPASTVFVTMTEPPAQATKGAAPVVKPEQPAAVPAPEPAPTKDEDVSATLPVEGDDEEEEEEEEVCPTATASTVTMKKTVTVVPTQFPLSNGTATVAPTGGVTLKDKPVVPTPMPLGAY